METNAGCMSEQAWLWATGAQPDRGFLSDCGAHLKVLTRAGAEECGTAPWQFSQDMASFLILAEWASFRSFHLAISIISFHLLCEGIIFLEYLLTELFIWLPPGLCCGMWDLVPWPQIELVPPAVEGWSLNHWTTRKVPLRGNDLRVLLIVGYVSSYNTLRHQRNNLLDSLWDLGQDSTFLMVHWIPWYQCP